MKKIIVPAKTFNLYLDGQRTFIHLKKEREEELKILKYGERVLLVNEENEKEFIEQTFWFLYSFKEIERFIFLAFKWGRNDDIHTKRMRHVQNELQFSPQDNFYSIYVEKNYQMYLYHQMQAYSSFFFITDDISMSKIQLVLEGQEPKRYIVINTLKIIADRQQDDIINVYSMVPLGLIGLK